MSNEAQQTVVNQLIAEIQERLSIIQSESQPMKRESMIENLAIDLLESKDKFEFYYNKNIWW